MLIQKAEDLLFLALAVAGFFVLMTLLLAFVFVRQGVALGLARGALDKASADAEHAQRRLLDILNAVPVALVETDASGKFTFANRAAHQLLGRRDSELLGLRFHSATWGIAYPDGRLIPPDLLPAARALRGQTVKGFQHLLANPGTRRKIVVSATSQPILNTLGEVMGSSTALVEVDSYMEPEAPTGPVIDPHWFQAAPTALFALDPFGKILVANAVAGALVGVPPESLAGKVFLDVLGVGEARPDEAGEVEAILRDETRRLRFLDVDVPSESGEDTVRVRAVHDVSAWREAEVLGLRLAADLKTARRDLAAAERSGVGIWSYDVATGEVSETPLAEQLLHPLRADDPDVCEGFTPPDDRAAVMTAFQRVLSGGAESFESDFRVVAPDGAVRWVCSSGFAVRDEDGRLATISGSAVDITALKSAEVSALESEQRFVNIADAASALLRMATPAGVIDYINPAWRETTGAAPTQLAGRAWAELLHPDDRVEAVARFDEAVARRLKFKVTYRLRGADGRWRWIEETGAPRYDGLGRFRGYVMAGLDISDVIQAQQASAQLADARALDLGMLADARRKAEAAFDRVESLESSRQEVGRLALDFRSLLGALSGALELIHDHADETEKVAQLSQAGLQAGRRGERLVREIAALAGVVLPEPVAAEAPPASEAPLNASLALEGLRRSLAAVLSDPKRLEFDIAPDLGAAPVLETDLAEALTALLRNAEEAGGSQPIRLLARRTVLAEGEIEATPAGDYLVFAVVDQGHGMSPETLSQAVEPFFSTKPEGAGLGLALADRIARSGGGGLKLHSAPGEGTTAELYLPYRAEAVLEGEVIAAETGDTRLAEQA